jgi:hypothetical protein
MAWALLGQGMRVATRPSAETHGARRVHVVFGVFRSLEAAEQSKQELARLGIDVSRIVLSRPLAEDGIAAEAPGQNYENQPGERPSFRTDYVDDILGGAALLTVEPHSTKEKAKIELLLQRTGAYRVGDRPLD